MIIMKIKFNSKLTYSKKYLKVKKKGAFQYLYARVILIDAIYRKD